MGLIKISAVRFDPETMVLHFNATARLGTTLTTIVSSILLPARPIGDTALRWAILQRVHAIAA